MAKAKKSSESLAKEWLLLSDAERSVIEKLCEGDSACMNATALELLKKLEKKMAKVVEKSKKDKRSEAKSL